MSDKGTKQAMPVPPGKYIGSVKVGPKGQIVIPKEARELLGINPGDSLLLLADTERGIAINSFDYFHDIANAIFSAPAGRAGKGDIDFANAVHHSTDGTKE